MKYAYTFQQMREADEATIAGGEDGYVLMERAGKRLAEVVDGHSGNILVVSGGGNNGGDGFVCAEYLKEWGRSVKVLCLAQKFSPTAERAKRNWTGETLTEIPESYPEIIVDCVLGTGTSRAPEGEIKTLIEWMSESDAIVVSADIPSGLGENGVAYEPHVSANDTVTMGLLKSALVLEEGADLSGKTTVAEIGIKPTQKGYEIWEEEDVKAFFLQKKKCSNKGTYGACTVFAGSERASGAAFLAVGACLRSGVGYTKLFLTEPLFSSAIGIQPDAILSRFEGINGAFLASDCIVTGMGLGVSKELYALLVELLSTYTGTLVLDADALNTLAEYGVEILHSTNAKVVLTPHLKEFSRLVKKPVSKIKENLVREAERFAEEYGVTLLLKSNTSVVTDGKRTALNLTGSPCMAKGGSGDVLAGYLGGTVGRGVPPFEACVVSSYVMGKAGELAENDMGQYAPKPSDTIDYLGRVTKF